MFSQTAEYALRACVYLAGLPAGTTATASTISEATKVPFNYLQKILRMLVAADILSAQRGQSGGFTMARPPSSVSILDALNAVECPVGRIERCPLGIPGHTQLCTLHRLMDDQLEGIERTFAQTSIDSMLTSIGGVLPLCDSSKPMPINIRTIGPDPTIPTRES